VDINQVYRAPSIPKLGKKNVSSSVLRGATTPKLTRTRFSFIKPKITADALKSDISDTSAAQSLIETNRILVEIQRQLSIDFAMRIADEKNLLKRVKKEESKRKFAAKEKFIESTNKIGSALGGTVGKIVSPIKSVFDKIKEFFSLILTGIVLNAAFKWLQNPENQARLEKVFNFIGTYWKELIGVFLGIKLAGIILKLVGLARLLGLGAGGGSLLDCAGVMKCFATSVVPFLAANPHIVNQIGTSLLGSRQFLTGLGLAFPVLGLPFLPGSSPTPAPKPKPKPKPKPDLTFDTDPFYQDQPGFNWGDFALGSVGIFGSLLWYFLSGGNNFDDLLKKVGGVADGGTIPGKKCSACSLKASNGMTVPGQGPGWIDSVRAMLAPGEEVIKTSSAMLYRPLLKDINDNAGRMWKTFSEAVTKMLFLWEVISERSDEFKSIMEDFDEYLQEDIQRNRGLNPAPDVGQRTYIAGPGGTPGMAKIAPAPKITNTNVIINPPSGGPGGSGGMNFLPMILPKQSGKMPTIPEMESRANDVPLISPINFSNPWMDISPEWYGIQLYG